MTFDALIVGGSFAGLSAALQLARARRRIAVVDAGQRRNRFVDASHGFLGQDGRAPGDIVADAKAQLLAYPCASWHDGLAIAARRRGEGFEVDVGGNTLFTRRLVLATGVADELPAVEGLAERWGQTVFHCPYCHGYELDQGAIGVLASSPLSMHHALMLPDWGPTTFFLNGAFEPDAAQSQALAARGVAVEATPIARIRDALTVELVDGRRLPLAGLFTATRTRMASPLAEQLGCEFEQGPAGPYLRRTMMETTVPGVFACGDAAMAFANVAISVGDGAMTGAAVHRSLIPGLQ
ncbi:thioredoxin reductase [Pelomonas saccharophila]|uniref:Thioredoxin reductase n=1 Tax=Roseateles saccharophilus TaxID=304 RepID=A0ABU1YRL6_ROSSA|nr:NAD(P)/FAD-dependent oxidoreductase [Roseateles saccharophilus]MDR7271501.1 thioredoxin reductase [Roseateles saccharophilus]